MYLEFKFLYRKLGNNMIVILSGDKAYAYNYMARMIKEAFGHALNLTEDGQVECVFPGEHAELYARVLDCYLVEYSDAPSNWKQSLEKIRDSRKIN